MSRSHTEISEEKKAPRWEYLYKLVLLYLKKLVCRNQRKEKIIRRRKKIKR